MVELLSQAGNPQEEEKMIKEMPCKPNEAAWTAFHKCLHNS